MSLTSLTLTEGTGPRALEQPFLTAGCGVFLFVKTHQAIHFFMYTYGNTKQNQTSFDEHFYHSKINKVCYFNHF